jgi:short-subunit dehydrogenase
VENTPPDIVREILDVNFEAPLFAIQLALPIMRAQGSGHIINISSLAGKRGLPLSGIYSATKFALQGITESLRVEVAGSGIDVSIINPGATETEFGDNIRLGDVTRKFKAMGRIQPARKLRKQSYDASRRRRQKSIHIALEGSSPGQVPLRLASSIRS